MEGFDAVVFAYGQTASGKTFTLVRFSFLRSFLFFANKAAFLQSGNNSNPGIIPQAVSDIFGYIREVSSPPFSSY
jgi:centromeric protein E